MSAAAAKVKPAAGQSGKTSGTSGGDNKPSSSKQPSLLQDCKLTESEIAQAFGDKFTENADPVLAIRNAFVALLKFSGGEGRGAAAGAPPPQGAGAGTTSPHSTTSTSPSAVKLREKELMNLKVQCLKALEEYDRCLEGMRLEKKSYMEHLHAVRRQEEVNRELLTTSGTTMGANNKGARAEADHEVAVADGTENLSDAADLELDDADVEDFVMMASEFAALEDEVQTASAGDAGAGVPAGQEANDRISLPPLERAHQLKMEILQAEVMSRFVKKREKQEEELYKKHVTTTRKSRAKTKADISSVENDISEAHRIKKFHEREELITERKLQAITDQLQELANEVKTFEASQNVGRMPADQDHDRLGGRQGGPQGGATTAMPGAAASGYNNQSGKAPPPSSGTTSTAAQQGAGGHQGAGATKAGLFSAFNNKSGSGGGPVNKLSTSGSLNVGNSSFAASTSGAVQNNPLRPFQAVAGTGHVSFQPVARGPLMPPHKGGTSPAATQMPPGARCQDLLRIRSQEQQPGAPCQARWGRETRFSSSGLRPTERREVADQ
eukprot:g7253.t1